MLWTYMDDKAEKFKSHRDKIYSTSLATLNFWFLPDVQCMPVSCSCATETRSHGLQTGRSNTKGTVKSAKPSGCLPGEEILLSGCSGHLPNSFSWHLLWEYSIRWEEKTFPDSRARFLTHQGRDSLISCVSLYREGTDLSHDLRMFFANIWSKTGERKRPWKRLQDSYADKESDGFWTEEFQAETRESKTPPGNGTL